jgi:hypothetical protein
MFADPGAMVFSAEQPNGTGIPGNTAAILHRLP